MLVTASVLIAAAGYIINDYFDINIDRINKPDKLVVDKLIGRRWAMFFHLLLSLLGIALTAYVSLKLQNIFLFLFNLLSVLLLWFYSTTLKRKLLSGNIIISLLTAWVVLVLCVAELNWPVGKIIPNKNQAILSIYKLAVLYGGFAFVVSLIREIIKDMEDQEGDRKNDCKTMPIVWGSLTAKIFVSVWVFVLLAMLLVMLIYALFNSWFLFFIYILLLLVFPLIKLLRRLKNATSTSDFHSLSSDVKRIMFFGILSMGIYFYYNR
jgi:4-hydroxybenzoate polyprenyltransferase